MAFSQVDDVQAFVASGDLSTSQYHIVDVIAAFKVANAGARLGYGVLQNKPKDGEHASVCIEGVTKVVGGAAIAVGDLITSAGSGFGATVASGSAGTKQVIGRALTACASGSVFSMYVDRQIIVATGALPS